MLGKNGFEVKISDTLDCLADEDELKTYNLIVSCWTMGEINEKYVKNLSHAVAAAYMICHGSEIWHPDPAFFYQHGGGPMLDMGTYYISALVNLIGAIKSVCGVTKASFPQRPITSQPLCGTVIDVEGPTCVTGILQFENGAVGTVLTAFDVYYKGSSRFEIYGTKGSFFVPGPNCFGGPVKVLLSTGGEVCELPLMFGYSDNSRGLGISDMVEAIENKHEMRLSWRQTLYALEIMESFEKSSNDKNA